MHVPVLLKEVLEYLDPQPGAFIIDGTVNGGGHARAIIETIAPGGTFLGIDWDEDILERTKRAFEAEKKKSDASLIWTVGNYANIPEILREKKLPKADGLLLDLGFSSEQLESSGKGFSFMKDEPLLMTYGGGETSAKELLRSLTERELAKIIFELSGEKFAPRIARAIKTEGRKTRIETTAQLKKAIESAVPKNYERGRIDPATRTFQALRIYANCELENLEHALGSLGNALKEGGRVAVISFHSLEDRIVKQKFRELAKDTKLEILTKKPIEASAEEIKYNPRSRSAKLRAAEVLAISD